jgi:hypothetical protein
MHRSKRFDVADALWEAVGKIDPVARSLGAPTRT